MTENHSNDILPPPQRCECYKKLQTYGVPLYITEEEDFYSESAKVIPYENAFRLPGFIKINENVSEFPIVEDNELSSVFDQMAQILPNLSDFEQNVVSFWILDVFIEALWTAQNAKMSHNHQRATLLWVAYFFNFIQKQNPSRKDLFGHLKVVLFHPEYSDEYSGEEEDQLSESELNLSCEEENGTKTNWKLPLPPDLTKSDSDSTSTEEQTTNENTTTDAEKSDSVASGSKEEENDSEVNLKDMKIILQILYRIFGRLWVFLELQTVFAAMPPVEQVDLPFRLNVPKPVFRPEPSVQLKVEKGGKRPALVEKSSEEIETERELHKHDYILPLQVAEESKTYLKQLSGQPTSDRSVHKNREERAKK